MVRAPYAPSHERLKRADPLYDLILLTDWNWPQATPGHGSLPSSSIAGANWVTQPKAASPSARITSNGSSEGSTTAPA